MCSYKTICQFQAGVFLRNYTSKLAKRHIICHKGGGSILPAMGYKEDHSVASNINIQRSNNESIYSTSMGDN